MPDALLQLTAVDAGYHGLAVVRDLGLRVDAGEVVALMGPNGAGKTTTILTISGFLRCLHGEVRIMGTPANDLRSEARVALGVGVVPDDRGLFPRLTVRQHLALAADRRDSPVDRALGHLPELSRLLDEKVGVLSGGEQQMVAIARALAHDPRLLLVDEMSLGLAPLVAERLADVLWRLATEAGIGVLLIEQHATLALRISDRVVVLEHGDTRFSGPADDLRRDPQAIDDLYLGVEPGGPTEADEAPRHSTTAVTA
jgi:branched-chain amino acid transport system ATP-binding protein